MNPINHSYGCYPLINKDHQLMIESCTRQFEQMKIENPSLFQETPRICEMDPEAVFSLPYGIYMDDSNVVVCSVNQCPYLGTIGLATCFAVAAKGVTEDDEVFISLAHINLISPREALEGMMRSFRQKGCSANAVEFYIIGGMLPNEGIYGDTDSSFDKQKEFISLKDEYNIKSVYFNHINDDEGSLSVVMTEDGAQWTTRHDAFDILCDSEEDYASSSEFDSSSISESGSSEETSSEEEDFIEQASLKRVNSFDNEGPEEKKFRS